MDDYQIDNLYDSRNEWSSRLVTLLTPTINEGFNSIFEQALKVCDDNDESEKYLMTFQNFIKRIPQWNSTIINNEVKRIENNTKCSYITDLITCVHITHLKALTCIKVGEQTKKVDIDIPDLDNFIHKIYINVARKLYTSIYLFEVDVLPLEKQKRNKEFESLIKQSILDSIRENIPIDNILRAYLEESEDITISQEETKELIKIGDKDDNVKLNIETLEESKKVEDENENKDEIKITKIDSTISESNNDNTLEYTDSVMGMNTKLDNDESTSDIIQQIEKTIEENTNVDNKDENNLKLQFNDENLESQDSTLRSLLDDDDDYDDYDDNDLESNDGNVKLKIGENISLRDDLLVKDLSEPTIEIKPDPILEDVEILF